MPAHIRLPQEQIADLCRRHHISKLALFGSVLRGDFRPDSDVDILVEFEPPHTPGMLGLARIERELTTLVGRQVDLRTTNELSRYFRQDVLSTAEVEYAQ